MEDRGDEPADLKAAASDTWSWARATARTGAKALDPRLDATAYSLVSMLCWRGAMRPSDLAAELTRLLGQLTAVDLR